MCEFSTLVLRADFFRVGGGGGARSGAGGAACVPSRPVRRQVLFVACIIALGALSCIPVCAADGFLAFLLRRCQPGSKQARLAAPLKSYTRLTLCAAHSRTLTHTAHALICVYVPTCYMRQYHYYVYAVAHTRAQHLSISRRQFSLSLFSQCSSAGAGGSHAAAEKRPIRAATPPPRFGHRRRAWRVRCWTCLRVCAPFRISSSDMLSHIHQSID